MYLNSMAFSNLAPTTITLLFISSHSCFADTNSLSGSLSSSVYTNQSSTWTSNLNNVFNSLRTNVDRGNGYYKAVAGKGRDSVFALIQCRGDVSPENCSECTQESFRLATNYCGGSRTCVIWQKWCVLRYDNASFFGSWEGSAALVPSGNTTSLVDPNTSMEGLNMMYKLAADAPNENLRFARSATGDRKRYGLAQCTQDLRKKDCRDCLDHLMESFAPIVNDTTPWGIYSEGCFMMYDHYQFYFNSSTTWQSATDENSSDTGEISYGWIVMCMAIFTTVLFLSS